MDRNRLMELALDELLRRKAAIEADIEAIRTELEGTGSSREIGSMPTTVYRRERRQSSAQRRAHSLRMKQYWASKRAQAKKSSSEPESMPTGSVMEEKAEIKKTATPQKKHAKRGAKR